MADIYYSSPTNCIHCDNTKGYFTTSFWDAKRIMDTGQILPEGHIIGKLISNFDKLFDPNKEMLDIGANVGTYTISVGSKFKKVHAFEPNKQFSYVMHANIALCNMINNVNIYEDLLSNNEDPVQFNGFAGDRGNLEQVYDEIETIIPKTLDSFNFDNIGFVKIDVEGMEERILRGGEEMLKKNGLPPILFESWSADQDRDLGISKKELMNMRISLCNYLESLGYEIFLEWGQFDTHLAVKKNK